MKFYHVLISHEKEPDSLRQIFEDLDENELKQKFLLPYRKGKSLICGGEVVPVKQIKKVRISRTDQCNEVERDKLLRNSIQQIEKLNVESDGSFVIPSAIGSYPGDILEDDEDVTEKYIVDSPGYDAGSSPFSRFVAHPMVVMVVGSLVVAFVVWVLGWGK